MYSAVSFEFNWFDNKQYIIATTQNTYKVVYYLTIK